MTNKTPVLTYYVIVIADPHGAVWGTVVKSLEDGIQIAGLQNASGKDVFLETAPASLVPVWCREHGLQWRMDRVKYPLTILLDNDRPIVIERTGK